MAQTTTHTIDNFWAEYAGQAMELVKGQVVVYQADGSATTLNADGILTGGAALPELQIELAKVFPHDD